MKVRGERVARVTAKGVLILKRKGGANLPNVQKTIHRTNCK